MAATQSRRVHGNSVIVEHPHELDAVWLAGFFARIHGKPGRFAWFHFAASTPLMMEDMSACAVAVNLRFRTPGRRAWVASVHVFDGEHRIAAFDGLSLSPEEWSTHSWEISGQPRIHHALGISVCAGFRNDTLPAVRAIEFSAAGGDFLPRTFISLPDGFRLRDVLPAPPGVPDPRDVPITP